MHNLNLSYLGLINIDEGVYNSSKLNTYGLPEEGEDILVHVISRLEALTLLEQGKISNAATIIGLQWLALNYKSLQDNSVKRS